MIRPLLAVPVYLAVAVMSFWSFGDDGVTGSAVVIAAALNFVFGLVFGWRYAWLPLAVFGLWGLSVQGGCEDCQGLFVAAGATASGSALIGAATRQVVTAARGSAAATPRRRRPL
jgi:hypothetical protein